MPSYDQIAKHGEMSRQLIRHYFSNEEDMVLALLEALQNAYRDCLVQTAIAAVDGRRLQVFIDFLFDLMRDRGLPKPADDQMFDVILSYANTHPKVKERLHSGYELVQMTLAHEIQVSFPDLPQSACKELGYLIVVAMYGHWKMVIAAGFSEDYSLVARDAVNRLIESYAANYVAPEE